MYYCTDTYVNKAFFRIVRGVIDESRFNASEAPDVSENEFWESELSRANSDYSATINLDKNSLDKELKKMVSYCNDNNITIIGIVPIGHSDLYSIYDDYKTEFIDRITDIFPTVYDFFFPNEFTINRDNFGDPFHAHGENWIYLNGLYNNDSVHCKKYIK